MREKIVVRLSLVVGFCGLLFFVLICGLSGGAKAKPNVSPAAVTPEGNRVGLLDFVPGVSVCEQTQNLAPNPRFEHDGEAWTDHWYESGRELCDFTYDDPGHDSEVSAQINASTSRVYKCVLFTPIHETPVQGGKWYDYSAWVQADLSQGDAYLHISFWGEEQGELGYLGSADTTLVMDTHGVWIQVTGSVEAPTEAKYARLEATLPGSSKGWVRFDDVFLGLSTCLEIGKEDEPDRVSPGDTLNYTITYGNSGREGATDVQVIDKYSCVKFVVESQPPPISYTNNIWETPYLGAGVSSMITIRVRLQDPITQATIVNGVQIRSDETTKPVYTITTTSIDPNGDSCDIDVYVPDSEKAGAPGRVTEYDLVLTNVGTCNGEARLVATSSGGWDVIITPEPPYTMLSEDQQVVKLGVDVPENASDNMVDVTSITATLDCGSPCNKTVTKTTMVTTTVEQPRFTLVYMPLVLRQWPLVLTSPELDPIENTDGDGQYEVHWTAEALADSYVLQEDTNRFFPWPTKVYTGSNTGCCIEDRGAARYHYRVKSRNTSGDSAWSDWEAADVVRELEPSDFANANGPLVSCIEYHGLHDKEDDEWDCFKIHADASGRVAAYLSSHECSGVQLLLYYESSDNMVKRDWKGPSYEVSYDGPKGWYYICIYAPEQIGCTGTPYILVTTFPES